MADHDDPVEETVMLTRRGQRSLRVNAGAPADDAAQDALDAANGVDDRTIAVKREDGVEDRTIAVRRENGVDDRTIAVKREDGVEDRTIAVDRRLPSADGSVGAAPQDDLEDHTVVVDRTPDAAPQAGAALIEHPEDHTAVVDRTVRPPAPRSSTVEADDLDATIPAAPARRVEVEPLPSIYKPRPAPLMPSRPPAVEGGIAPTRVIDVEAASVSRAARRTSAWVLAAVAGACVVSVCGLVTLAFVVFA